MLLARRAFCIKSLDHCCQTRQFMIVGGMNSEIRGKSKAGAYRKYAAAVDREGQNFLDHNPDAKHKKLCKSLMQQDPETGEWVLRYRWQM